MGFIKFSLAFAVMVALCGVLMQKYSPDTIDKVLSNPTVQQVVTNTDKFIKDATTKINETSYPLYLKVEGHIKPLIGYLKIKLNKLYAVFDETASPVKANQAKAKSTDKKGKERIMTVEELKKYDGKPGSKGLYLSLLGQVFNVKKGKDHYGPGGGYHFFAGRDASRAFVSGNFEEDGLTDDIRGLSNQDFIGLSDWLEFYHKDYTYVGKLAGRYYSPTGEETEYKLQATRWISEAKQDQQKKATDKQVFPPCNSEWSQDKGSRVWCTTKSGGVERSWAGVPRQLFTPGEANPRCACVKDSGAPTAPVDVSAPPPSQLRGDLDHPHVKEYPGCDVKSDSCVVPAKNE